MQDETANDAPVGLGKQIIHATRVGLGQVEALLTLRSVHMPAVLTAESWTLFSQTEPPMWRFVHLSLRRVVILQASWSEQKGQTASPSVSGERILHSVMRTRFLGFVDAAKAKFALCRLKKKVFRHCAIRSCAQASYPMKMTHHIKRCSTLNNDISNLGYNTSERTDREE